MHSYYNPDVSFAVSEICLKSAVLDHGQIDQVDRRFNLDPTTPNCIYLGTLN